LFTAIIFYHLKFSLVDTADLDGVLKGFVLSPKPYKVKFTAREVLPYTCDSDIDTEEDYVTDTTLYLTDG